MKKSIYALVFGIFILTSSCQKDINVVQSSPDNTTSTTSTKKSKANSLPVHAYRKQSDCYNAIYAANGMLVFTDANHFKTTLECLEQQVQDYNQAFADQYGSLSDNQISDIMESTNFNEFQPLIDFESNLPDYKSLRNKVEGAKWLNKPDLDMSTYPRNVSVIGQGLRTLVNEAYKVKIGNDIVDLSVNTNGFSAALATSSTCGMFGYSRERIAFDSDSKRLVVSCGLAPALFGSVVAGEAYVYRKSNGLWKNYSTRINSHITGRLLTLNCDFDQDFSKFDDVRNRSSVNPKHRVWFRPTMMAHDYEILLAVELPNLGVYRQMNIDIWY